MTACQMLPHYDNFARLGWYHDARERVEAIVARFGALLQRAGQDTILLANGSDHLPVEPELPEICRALAETFGTEFRIGRYSEFAPEGDGLPVHEGELVGSRLQNGLRGVNSARLYLKQANERAERRLLAAETAAALRSLREGTPFPAADVRLAWRDLLRNHPHDSICGCSCDEVHRDMLVRYEQLDRTLELVERSALGVGGALVNPLPYRRRRLVGDALVELDGFEGRRAEPLAASRRDAAGRGRRRRHARRHRPAHRATARRPPRARGRARRRRPLHVLPGRPAASRGVRGRARRPRRRPRPRARARLRAPGRAGRDACPGRPRHRPRGVPDDGDERRRRPPPARALPRPAGRGRGSRGEPVRGRPAPARAAGPPRRLGRAAGADGAHARCGGARPAGPAAEGAARVRGRARRDCA